MSEEKETRSQKTPSNKRKIVIAVALGAIFFSTALGINALNSSSKSEFKDMERVTTSSQDQNTNSSSQSKTQSESDRTDQKQDDEKKAVTQRLQIQACLILFFPVFKVPVKKQALLSHC